MPKCNCLDRPSGAKQISRNQEAKMAKVSNWQKFILLLWKNWKQDQKILLIVDILIPVLLSMFLVLLRLAIDPVSINSDGTKETTPSSLRLAEYQDYANENDMEQILTVDNYLAGVQFDENTTGLLPVQQSTSMAYQKSVEEKVVDPFPILMQIIMPFLLTLTFLHPAVYIVRNIVKEREKQLKEVMKIMGLSNWIHWTAWFVKSFIMLAISSLLIAIIFNIKFSDNVAVLTYSEFTVFYFFMLIYITASICFCFMLSTFFNTASKASLATGLIWFVSVLPFLFTLKSYKDMDLSQKLAWCLIVNTAMGFGFKQILDLEIKKEGLQWRNLFTATYKTDLTDFFTANHTEKKTDTLTMGAIMLVMLASSVICMLICLYVEAVLPREFGVPKKWYFIFTKDFWSSTRHNVAIEDIAGDKNKRRNPNAFESEPTGKHVGIQVRNLKKQFGEHLAVRDLSMNMYEDEITVLLGHNGAGKTTTISMLVGMFPPTSGTAIINGYDIRTNMDNARDSLGICPQHNVLFDRLTVANHIVFFSRLKGLKGKAVQQEVDKYLRKMQLEDKANVKSSQLSGGMKRKLSLCCALCGDTKVVLCDEPSSGMDPSARRQLWDLLQAEKVGRTLLLTTHFMDEADVLGDRIAILADGELKCHGTPFFLKKKYGSGYHLICLKRDDCKVSEVTAFLRNFIPNIKPESNIGSELSYQLSDADSAKFKTIFSALENNSKKLHLDGYGVAITSMEEVFMKIGVENSQASGKADGDKFDTEYVESAHSDHIFSENKRLLQGKKLYWNQLRAMFLKKIIYTWRNKVLLLAQNLIPTSLAMLTLYYGPKDKMAFNLCFGMCFVTAFCTIFLIKERTSRSKLLQHISGIGVWTFWLTQFIFDFAMHTVTSVLVIIAMVGFKEPGFATFDELGRILLVLLLFGCAALPFTYLIAYFYDEPAAGYARVTLLNIFAGLVLFISVISNLEYNKSDTAKTLAWVFCIFPHFAFSMCINKLYKNVKERQDCDEIIATYPANYVHICKSMPKCCSPVPFFDWETPGILLEVTFMAGTAVLWLLLAITCDHRFFKKLFSILCTRKRTPRPRPAGEHIDDDVLSEKKRIAAMSKDQLADQNLVLDNVSKYYGKFLAVKQISLCVKQKECFGLLGVNGAGKTTTFKMMIGDESISIGSAYVTGKNLSTDMNKAYKDIGYCPQFDALLGDYTGRETLKMYGLIRGIQRERISVVAEELAKAFGFFNHLDKQVHAYSGGSKRKLSSAIAILGGQSVVFLDEPTTGIDPAARRQLWNIMCRVRDAGKSIVLTSHSMDECEALCTRLAIMVNGEFKCIGSTQHLKNKFPKGLIMKIKTKRITSSQTERDVRNVKDFVNKHFEGAKLQEEYQGILTFSIPPTSVQWSEIFGLMESNREALNIEDYSINQTTLEQVFLEFAKTQKKK